MHPSLLLLVGCSPDGPVQTVETASGSPPEAPEVIETDDEPQPDAPAPADPADYEAFFDVDVVHEVRVTLANEAYQALVREPREYVEGGVEIDGVALEPVGVRLKGSSTFKPIDEKAAFKFKFNEYIPHQRYAGVKRLALNNMSGDPAQGREVLAYTLWAAGGMSVPRCTFAQVYVNDALYGLYAVLEGMDEAFLEKRYALPDGDLWEADDGAELTEAGIPFFSLNAGKGDVGALERAAEVLTTETDDYYASAGTVVVMDQFLDFWAWSMVTGTIDMYPHHLNDYFLYANPGEGGRFEVFPWGMDETWEDTWRIGWGHAYSLSNGCLGDRGCAARVPDHVQAALEVFEAVDAPSLADRVYATTDEAMRADPRRSSPPEEVQTARETLRTMLEGWPARVRAALEAEEL